MGLAVRLPKSVFLRKIVRQAGTPVVSTSFNVSGQPVRNNVDFLAGNKLSKKDPELIINGGPLNNRPSMLIDLRGDQIKILRK